jgi:SAM-dependent methyltransferase
MASCSPTASSPDAEPQAALRLEPRACPVCGERSERVLLAGNVVPERLDAFAYASRKDPEYMHLRMVECEACRLLFADPAPAGGGLEQLYHEAEFDSADEAEWASRAYAARLPEIAARIADRRGALDVGTGTGSFLAYLAAAGFGDVRGIEPSAKPVDQAPPEVRGRIIRGIFRRDDFAPQSLSLVTCFQTLEHLADPHGFCKDVHALLRPGGALYVVVHDRRALQARVLGTKSPIFDFEHLQLFCRPSLEAMLARAGFRDVSVAPLWNCYPLRYWARLFPFPAGMKARIVGALSRPATRGWRVALPAGNLSAVAYK